MTHAASNAEQPLDASDEAVLAALRHLHEVADPVPDGMVDRVVHAVAWHEVQAEVARIVDHGSQLVGARGTDDGHRRTMTFSGTTTSITVMISRRGEQHRRVDGWVTNDGPGGLAVRLRHLGATQHAQVGQDGRFAFEEVDRGPAQFVLERGDEHLLVTPTVEL